MRFLNNKVSVIIPVYNVEIYLDRCLESVLNQTYKNIEIIIVNDGSTDNSADICYKYSKIDSRVIFIDQINKGVSSARNAALKKASGNYIYFIDSDDYIENNTIELLLKTCIKDKTDIVSCNYYKEQVNGKREVIIKKDSFIMDKETFIKELIDPNSISGFLWNKFYKKDLIDVNICKFDETVKIMEDLLFNLEISEKVKKVSYLDYPLYHYIQRDNSALNNKDILKMKSSLSVYLKIIFLLEKYYILGVNRFKLLYIINSLISKNYSTNLKIEEIEEINLNIKKFINEKVFFSNGNFKLKIKAIILMFFPYLYRLFKKIKKKGK